MIRKKKVPPIMDFPQAQAYLRIPRSSLYQLCQQSRIPCYKEGREWRFVKRTLDRWVSGLDPERAEGEWRPGELID